MIKEHQTIEITSQMEGFRNRFAGKRNAMLKSKKMIPLQNYFKSLMNPEKYGKYTKRQAVRYLAKAFLFFILLVTAFVLWPVASKLSVYFLSSFKTVPVAAPFQPAPDWHERVAKIRPDDVINPRYDHLAISIILKGKNFISDAKIHSSIGTFLKQMKYLQVCNQMIANTFVGGKHDKVLPFFIEVPELPILDRYIDGFKTMIESAPDQDWYIQIDDDSYLFVENLNNFLEKFDPSEPVFIHNFAVFREDAVHMPKLDSHNHLPTAIFSRAAIQKFTKSDYARCLHKNMSIPSMGTILVRCIKELGIKVFTEKSIHVSEPAHDFGWPSDPCEKPIAFSQLSPKQIEYMYRAQPSTGVSSTGKAYKWDSVVTYADVFQHTLDDRITVGIDRHSFMIEDYKLTESGADCQKLCINDPSCISWTFDVQKCYTSDTIGTAHQRENVISGLVMNRYYCNDTQ